MNFDKLNEAMRQSDELNSSISSEKPYTVSVILRLNFTFLLKKFLELLRWL